MEIKLFEHKELALCCELFVNVFNAAPWNDNWSFERASEYITDFYNTPRSLGVIALEDGKVIGFIIGVHRAWWSGNEFFIHEMCVDTSVQNRGIGKKLLAALVDALEDTVSNITLLTDRGIPAESFYKNNGFAEIERIIFLSKDI